ncbi:MAG: site-2 protease family protein [Bacillota bacterium]
MAFPDLQTLVMAIPGLIMGLVFHEFAHAITATWFGDDTPRLQGRVTLSPLAHLDPIGTLLLLIVGFGWARPVLVNTSKLRPRVMGDIAVSLAGVAMNFLLATLFFFLTGLAGAGRLGYSHPVLTETLFLAGWINVLLVALNLLPVPPLDGFHVFKYLIPNPSLVATLYRFGPFLLILLFITDVADRFIQPVMAAVITTIKLLVTPVLSVL